MLRFRDRGGVGRGRRVAQAMNRGGEFAARESSAARADLPLRPTRLEQALDWAQALAPTPKRIASGCCGMAMVSGGDPFELLGAGPPAVSARAADLLIVAGSITRRQAPILCGLYERMLEPRWVIAWGACAISGGAYQNYATVPGLGTLLPVDLVVPGCPPRPESLRAALEALRSDEASRPASGARSSRDPADWPILREGAPGPPPPERVVDEELGEERKG